MTNPEQLLKEARELCDKATPGPWKHTVHCEIPPNNCLTSVNFDEGSIANVQVWRSGIAGTVEETKTNAELMARSRTIIPELADALEASEKEHGKTILEAGTLAEKCDKLRARIAELEGDVREAMGLFDCLAEDADCYQEDPPCGHCIDCHISRFRERIRGREQKKRDALRSTVEQEAIEEHGEWMNNNQDSPGEWEDEVSP